MSRERAFFVRSFALAAAVLLVALAFYAFSQPARAHGEAAWIMESGFEDPVSKLDCCGVEDCKPMADGDVKITPGGYLLAPTGETIPESRALPSKDGRYWRCEVTWQPGRTRCFFRGLPGS